MFARALPLITETFTMLREGDAQRLKKAGDRAMQGVAKGDTKGEMTALAEVEFGGERNIAFLCRTELVVHTAVAHQVLPSVGCSYIAARATRKRYSRAYC